MYKEFELNTQEGPKTLKFLATGTTSYRFRQVFHQDLMVMLNNMESADKADTSVGDKLAYIMNMQAEHTDMNSLSYDSFMEWCDQFEGAELFLHMGDFVSLYLGSRASTSVPKKAAARQTVK